MKNFVAFAFSFLLIVVTTACNKQSPQNEYTESTSDYRPSVNGFPYDLANPSKYIRLAPVLKEISGIELVPSGQIAAVQDEEGVVFFLNSSTGEIEGELDFAGGGDYEDIAYLNGRLYIVRSDGRVYHTPWQGGELLSFLQA